MLLELGLLEGLSLQYENEFDNNFPRDTPAVKVQALIAKWMVQQIVRDNQVVEPPRRLQSGVMLFRPWDIWIQHALQLQKARS